MSLNVPNLDKLIAHLEAQPPEKFNMVNFYSKNGRAVTWVDHIGCINECGTAACIAGHIYEINAEPTGFYGSGRWLGIGAHAAEALFTPEGFNAPDTVSRYSLARAIATLKRLRDRFLASGEIVVDWGPEPGQEPAQPWSPPLAVEQTLPEEITRLLGNEVVMS